MVFCLPLGRSAPFAEALAACVTHMWVESGTLEATREFDFKEGLHQRDLVERAPYLTERCEVMYDQESRDDYGLSIIKGLSLIHI